MHVFDGYVLSGDFADKDTHTLLLPAKSTDPEL